jgi:hypothetical protein
LALDCNIAKDCQSALNIDCNYMFEPVWK